MRWNRSSYVNRLRQSDWIRLFAEAGFVMHAHEATVSDHTVRLLPQLRYLHKYQQTSRDLCADGLRGGSRPCLELLKEAKW